MIYLQKLAEIFYRSPEELKTVDRTKIFKWRMIIFNGFLGLLLSYFIYISLRNFHQWVQAKIEVKIPASSWSYIIEKNPFPCNPSAPAQSDCPANPGNPLLWENKSTLSDSYKIHKSGVAQGETIWMGTVLSKNDIKKAFEARAGHLILGTINGDFSVWVDGLFYFQGNHKDREPSIIPLPLAKMENGHPMKIAMKIRQEKGVRSGLISKAGFGQGFSDRVNYLRYLKLVDFSAKAKPISFFFSNLILALLFFLIWAYYPEKHEYFHISLFALIGAVVQLKKVSAYLDFYSPSVHHSLQIIICLMEGVFGMVVGLSFSRAKKSIINGLIVSSLILGMGAGWLIPDENLKVTIYRFLNTYSGAAGCILGALSCYLQVHYLNTHTTHKDKGIFIRSRQLRLILFGLALTCTSFFYFYSHYVDTQNTWAIAQWMDGGEIGQIPLMIFLFTLAALDFRAQKGLLEKTPVSKYHRLPQLPEKLLGAILVVDLKNSELLLRAGAKRGESGKFVHACMSHMWTAIIENNGILLLAEGDMLRAFFDRDSCKNSVLSALKAVDTMDKNLSHLTNQYEQKFLDDNISKLSFRGSISQGEIRPIWSQVGDLQYPDWIEAGKSNPFLESARLLEMERKFEEGDFHSQVSLMEEDVLELVGNNSPLNGHFPIRNRTMPGKHGEQYTIAIYRPEKNDTLGANPHQSFGLNPSLLTPNPGYKNSRG